MNTVNRLRHLLNKFSILRINHSFSSFNRTVIVTLPLPEGISYSRSEYC